jgi:biopolymer transport protein ExbB
MLSKSFLGISLVGAEWVLYLLLLLSIVSIAVILERFRFYRAAQSDLKKFRQSVRNAVEHGKWDDAVKIAEKQQVKNKNETPDLESGLTLALLNSRDQKAGPDILTEVAADSMIRAKIEWEKNLAILATIGSNAPFVGLFGTVLGIIKAFHDLSQQAATGAQAVTAGISEALVATAVGILVAIPAVVAFNLFQRKVKAAVSEAEALKSYLIGKLAK